jgi:hypothetical protein
MEILLEISMSLQVSDRSENMSTLDQTQKTH